MKSDAPVLSIIDLSVVIEDEDGIRTSIDHLSLEVGRGQTVALVGESGSGKTLTALSILRLLPSPARVTNGAICLDGHDMMTISEREMRRIRGDRIAMVFQEPNTSLNPLMSVGKQIAEAIRLHQGVGKQDAKAQVLALMELVGIPDPRRRYRSYPHQLSGGIRQRVVIAMALACRPDLLLADEPTSALDATVQAQIVDLMSRLIRDLGMSVLLITHDLGVVASMADRVIVIHEGRVIEEGTTREILKMPFHPYTKALLAARPLGKKSEPVARLAGLKTATSGEVVAGCPFAGLCPLSIDGCREQLPLLFDLGSGRKVRCKAIERQYE